MAETPSTHESNMPSSTTQRSRPTAPRASARVTTGVGRRINTARVEPRTTCGCGGTGASASTSSRAETIAGAERIIAIDTSDAKLEFARCFGATDLIRTPRAQDSHKQLKKLTGGGLDFFTHSNAPVGRRRGRGIQGDPPRRHGRNRRRRTGECNPPRSSPAPGRRGKNVTGSYFGSGRGRAKDSPRCYRLYTRGKLKSTRDHPATYKIDERPQDSTDLESGKNAAA